MAQAVAQSPVDLAPAEDPLAALPEADVLVEVGGVESLADYAAVIRLLGSASGVRRAGLEEAAGERAVFRVTVRGGADTLAQGLDASGRLTRSASAAAGRLVFDYQH